MLPIFLGHGLNGSGAYPFALSLELGTCHLSFGLRRSSSFACNGVKIGAVARRKDEPGPTLLEHRGGLDRLALSILSTQPCVPALPRNARSGQIDAMQIVAIGRHIPVCSAGLEDAAQHAQAR